MKVNYTPDDLRSFELDVIASFERKEILAPIHIYEGNEAQMIEIFENYVDEEDWVFCTWRSHFQCLLKGVPPDELLRSIKQGKSISLCFPKYRILSSAIVTGTIPIGLGTAWAIKRAGGSNKAVVWVGDMGAETGMFYECAKYAAYHKLPILFVVEDNNKSVCTDTRATWGAQELLTTPDGYKPERGVQFSDYNGQVLYYQYQSKFPHAGGGSRIQF